MAPQYRSFGFTAAKAGATAYISDEALLRTYAVKVGADGALTGWRLFAEQGGEAVAKDAAGKVYIANGNISVYSPAGKLLDVIVMPERPTGLVFVGKRLFIPTRTSLYALRQGLTGIHKSEH